MSATGYLYVGLPWILAVLLVALAVSAAIKARRAPGARGGPGPGKLTLATGLLLPGGYNAMVLGGFLDDRPRLQMGLGFLGFGLSVAVVSALLLRRRGDRVGRDRQGLGDGSD